MQNIKKVLPNGHQSKVKQLLYIYIYIYYIYIFYIYIYIYIVYIHIYRWLRNFVIEETIKI